MPLGDALSFDALQLRLHPAESRIRKLAAETPAQFMLFDLLALGGKTLADRAAVGAPRGAREASRQANATPACCSRPRRRDRDDALGWLERSGGALDGVIAKRLDQPYRSGERAMVKVKQQRTADCVVGGFRYAEKKQRGRLAAARPLRRRRPAPSCRLHLGDHRRGPRRR